MLHTGRETRMKKSRKVLSILLACLMAITPAASFVLPAAAAEETSLNYTLYDRTNGLLSSEANCLAETPDGMIWVGSYAGLFSFDGRNFTFIREGGIANVNALFTDSKGRLFVGTNDSGVAVYENGEFLFYTEDDGIPSESIRCFAEDASGNIFVGTSEGMFEITADGDIKNLANGLSYVNSICFSGDSFVCTGNSGRIYILSADGKSAAELEKNADEEKQAFYEGVFLCGKRVLAATAAGDIREIDPSKQTAEVRYQVTEIGELKTLFSDAEGRLWVGGLAGFGCFEKGSGTFTVRTVDSFNTSVSWIHEDYQGNIWLCSGDLGVLKMAASAFSHPSAGKYEAVTNALLSYKGSTYAATDQGLTILDGDGKPVTNALTAALKGARIRCLMADSRGFLWLSTYSDLGLVESDGENILHSYTSENSGMTSNRVRNTFELSDGTIAAGTADGLNFLRDGQVTGTITGSDGLQNTQILSLAETADGAVLAGTDGAGIYEICDGEISRHITKSEGLNSGIVMRLTPYAGGYFCVTSNSLAYLKDGKTATLTNFPYFNNFDVLIEGTTAYVLSSVGLYVLSADDLVNNTEDMQYSFYGVNEGLDQAMMANSYSILSGDTLTFCTSAGFMTFHTDFLSHTYIKYGIGSVYADDTLIRAGEDGRYTIPADTAVIKISPSIRNFSQTGVYVRMNIRGMTHNTEGALYEDAEPLTLTNAKKGTYAVRLEILSSPNGEVLSGTDFFIVKKPQLWENLWFIIGIAVLICVAIVLIVYLILRIFLKARRRQDLEQMQRQLEEELAEKTRVIRAQEEETEKLLMETVEALTNTIDAKDTYTSGHSRRVAKYSRLLAEKLGLSKEDCDLIYRAGLLHDVGKIRVPEEVINKPGRLTDEEFELMKIHPVAGFRIISGISWDKRICYGARFHHERYDGKGYPDKRAGEDIPRIARIIGVADAYDAMSSNRSYRAHMSQEAVREQIVKGRGTQFDPEVADAMLSLIDEDPDYRLCQADMGQRTVLICDDDKISFVMAQKILSVVGDVEISYAKNREEEMELLSGKTYDLILQDIWLPDGYGLDIMKEIHETRPDLPVIIMSGDMDLPLFEQAITTGAADFITKPFTATVLQEMVRGILYD